MEKVKTVNVLVKVYDEHIHIEINVGIPSYLHIRNFIYFSTIYSKKVNEYKHLIMLDFETKGLKKLSEGDGFVGDLEK